MAAIQALLPSHLILLDEHWNSVTHQWKLDTNIRQDISRFIIILQTGTDQLTITGQNRNFYWLFNHY